MFDTDDERAAVISRLQEIATKLPLSIRVQPDELSGAATIAIVREALRSGKTPEQTIDVLVADWRRRGVLTDQ